MKKQRKRTTPVYRSGLLSDGSFSKNQLRKLEKQKSRYLAFVNYFPDVPVYIPPHKVKELTAGLIRQHDAENRFLIHHKINYGGVVSVTKVQNAFLKDVN